MPGRVDPVFVFLGLFLILMTIVVLVWRGFTGGRRFTIGRMIWIIALIAIGLRLPAYSERIDHRNYRRLQSASNLRQIGLGLLGYTNQHNYLPPSTIDDPQGVPLHGWPSLILPYVDNLDLYNAMNFSCPWDDPTPGMAGPSSNQVITYTDIGIYRMSGTGVGPNQPILSYATNAWIIGGPKPRRLDSITDGLSQTILAGEAAGNYKPWGSPIHARDPNLGINRSPNGFGSPFPGGANFLFADGSVRFLRDTMPMPVFRALATPDGGEQNVPADPDEW